MKHIKPIELAPIFKTKVWAGARLENYFPDSKVPEHTGEVWLFSDLPSSETTVAKGEYKGMSPRVLAQKLGTAFCGNFYDYILEDGFPLLFKILDADALLSLQVHPDDTMAQKLEKQSRGKNESWYILDANAGSHLILGTENSCSTPKNLLEAITNSNSELLHKEQAISGETYFIPPGLLHSIGKGITLVEIQQSSDLTYRVSDWGRVGLDGKPRELHKDQAQQCIKLEKWQKQKKPAPSWSDDGGFIELISVCDYYYLEKITLKGRLEIPLEDDAFSLLLPLSKSIEVLTTDESISLTPYTASILSAEMTSITLGTKANDEDQTLLRAVPIHKGDRPSLAWRGHDADSLEQKANKNAR